MSNAAPQSLRVLYRVAWEHRDAFRAEMLGHVLGAGAFGGWRAVAVRQSGQTVRGYTQGGEPIFDAEMEVEYVPGPPPAPQEALEA